MTSRYFGVSIARADASNARRAVSVSLARSASCSVFGSRFACANADAATISRIGMAARTRPLSSIARNVKRHFLALRRAFVLALLFFALVFLFLDAVVANVFHHGLLPNCAASVEPASAVVDDCPFEITFITSSK